MTDNGRSRQAADPMGRLKSEAVGLIGALGDRAVTSLRDRVEDTAGRLTDFTDGGGNGGGASLMAAVTGAKGLAQGKSPLRAMAGAGLAGLKEKVTGMFGKGRGKGGKGKGLKVTNIVEQIDVGAPLDLSYNLWTQFAGFPSFMKKVESVEQAEDEKLNWKAQILWSHRTWESTILEQTPEEKIIWRSKGAKGYVDGAVTFHEIAPRLTRIILVLEYHPQGLFEHTGNLWRAQGRRVRLELKHFRRHLMSDVLLHPDDVEGWRGVIEDGQVVDDGNDDPATNRQDATDRQDEADQQGKRTSRPTRSRRASGEDEPGTGRKRAARAERSAPASRTERQRRGSNSESGSAPRARRPKDETRRAPARQRAASSQRAGGERSSRTADSRRSAK